MAKKNTQISFDEQLILFKYFLNEYKINSLSSLSALLNKEEFEGYNENNNTHFYVFLCQYVRTHNSCINLNELRLYDEHIVSYTRKINENREEKIIWKYYQYLALLFTEMYLDRYFKDKDNFCKDLNRFLDEVKNENPALINFPPFDVSKMNKLVFMCATGSGKTLFMHIHILQYQYYFTRAKKLNSNLSINKIILLAPNEGLSNQHCKEFKASGINAGLFLKNNGLDFHDVFVIDMNKLKEEGKVKTVSVDSFEKNNLVLIDEAHRGLSGDIWYDYRTRLSEEGFSFEYSATFKQALNANSSKKEERELMYEYGKSIIMDYSYKYFYDDGYGKDYRIYNLQQEYEKEQRILYLTGCLLSFYQQLKYYDINTDDINIFNIEKPLLVFVGNRVTAKTTKADLTDIEEILLFIDSFVHERNKSIENIRLILSNQTGLVNSSGQEFFYQDFKVLEDIYGSSPNYNLIFNDIITLLFNADASNAEPRLHLRNLKQIQGEIGLRIGEYGDYFGVISVGETHTLIKNCEEKGIVKEEDEFITESLFENINEKKSKLNILIGSKKFCEGWNSYRVSTMGLINFAKGEGSQAIQLFGRGVRLWGFNKKLKRSSKSENLRIKPPKFLDYLETLTIFGVKAKYMQDFKTYLEKEGMSFNSKVYTFSLPVLNRFSEVNNKKLKVIKVKDGKNFRKQSPRFVLDTPDDLFKHSIIQSNIRIDCRSKIESLESSFSTLTSQTFDRGKKIENTSLNLLDYDYIFNELEDYKQEKNYANLCIDKNKLKFILQTDGLYELYVSENELKIDRFEKILRYSEFAILILQAYMDRYYKFKRAEWEKDFLEFGDIKDSDKNFIDNYQIKYTCLNDKDTTNEKLEEFIKNMVELLKNQKTLDEIQTFKFDLNTEMVLFDFEKHLYKPLIGLNNINMQITISPVQLNKGETDFVFKLREFVQNDNDVLLHKDLYLLRNKSKMGMGFFEAGNFYPDFILWIIADDKQYISFIDPKGLVNVPVHDPKIQFYKKIKELELRLNNDRNSKDIILNSFIMSETDSAILKDIWNLDEQEREKRNVYTLDDNTCIEKMIKKILFSVQ